MNYPYPIPGSGTIPAPIGPYFMVGNECCNGGMTNDVYAITKVTFDYTNQLPAGVTITNIIYEVTPPSDQMLVLTNKVLTSPIATFMVGGGGVGQSYSVEAIAVLSDGQQWVDHIMVNVTDCDAMSGPNLLFSYGVITIANTLYYNATANQTVFNLNTPDEFGRIGSLADSNVLVYVNGLRQEPVDDYTVNVRFNTITLMRPVAAGSEIVFDLVAPPLPPPVYPPPVLITGGLIATSLYYFATGGQTVFPLWVPDRFNHIGSIATVGGNALVYVNGQRKEPVDDYTISLGANTITFVHPLDANTEVDFDLVTSPPPQAVIPPPVQITGGVISLTLYYVALGGQTVFSLGVPDEYNHVGLLTANGVQVYRSGNRLALGDGYTLNIPNNQVILLYPAGDSEPIVFDMISPLPAPIAQSVKMEQLPIITTNTLPDLLYAPDSVVLMLIVDGMVFFPPTAFTVNGKTLTWVSTFYSIPVGAAVFAVYTYA